MAWRAVVHRSTPEVWCFHSIEYYNALVTHDRLPPILLLVAALALSFCATAPDEAPHEIDSVEPDVIMQGNSAEITITGSGFDPVVRRNVGCSGETIDIDDDFEANLDDETLGDVKWVAGDILTASVPDDISPGIYDLSVATPDGAVAVLEDAFEVVSTSDADTDTDTDSDTEPQDGDGSDCEFPVLMDESGDTWVGTWGEFGQTFTPINDCGAGDQDVFVAVFHPAGKAIAITESSPVDVLLRHIVSCDDFTCVDYLDEPEWLCIDGDSSDSWEFIVVTEVGLAAPDDEVIVKLEFLTTELCADAY